MEVKLRMPEEHESWILASPASAEGQHCYKKYPLSVTLSHKHIHNFKLSWTNHGQHLKAVHFLFEDRWNYRSCLRNCELTSALSDAEKNWGENPQNNRPSRVSSVWKVVSRGARRKHFEPKSLAPLIRGQGCSCWAEEGQGSLSGRRISPSCPLRAPLGCRQGHGRKHKKGMCITKQATLLKRKPLKPHSASLAHENKVIEYFILPSRAKIHHSGKWSFDKAGCLNEAERVFECVLLCLSEGNST